MSKGRCERRHAGAASVARCAGATKRPDRLRHELPWQTDPERAARRIPCEFREEPARMMLTALTLAYNCFSLSHAFKGNAKQACALFQRHDRVAWLCTVAGQAIHPAGAARFQHLLHRRTDRG